MTPARLAALPSRSLTDQNKPHRYVKSVATDVAATMEKYRRLYALQARTEKPSTSTEQTDEK